jgi:hypothetical protein
MKRIKVDPDQKQALLEKFQAMLNEGRFSDGKISFTEDLTAITDPNIQKPTVAFTASAWLKMQQLVKKADGEIGWHGVVEKQNNFFTIKDIIVYPQTVSGATVTTDAVEYSTWLMNLDDETFNHCRYQGHSHVNFGVSPSGVDQQFYNDILQTLQESDYYIFMITNKRSDIYIVIYDYTNNILFETKDITVKVLVKGGDVELWANKAIQDNVKKIVHQTHALTKEEEKDLERRYGKAYKDAFFSSDKLIIDYPKATFFDNWTKARFLSVQRFCDYLEEKYGKKYKQFSWDMLHTEYSLWYFRQYGRYEK